MSWNQRRRPLWLLLWLVAAGCGGGSAGKDLAGAGVDASVDGPGTSGDRGTPSGQGDFVNGDFELGPDVGWTQVPYPLIVPASAFGVAAYSGQYAAVLGPGNDGRTSASLSQQVTLPAGPCAIEFAVWLDSTEPCDPPWWDDMGLYVDGDAIVRNDKLCSGDNTNGWQLSSADLSAYCGRTVTVTFRVSTVFGDALASTVGIDAVRIVH